jgi:hypothetical protein
MTQKESGTCQNKHQSRKHYRDVLNPPDFFSQKTKQMDQKILYYGMVANT